MVVYPEMSIEESNKKIEDKTGQDLLYWSISNGYPQIIKQIFKLKTATPQNIKDAILEGDIKVMKITLTAGKKQEKLANLDKVIEMLPTKRDNPQQEVHNNPQQSSMPCHMIVMHPA